MLIKLITHRFMQWKWMVIIPVISAPFLAGVMLLFADPTYVSTCRLWVKERAEGSELLKVQRIGPQQNTYVEVQRDIVSSNPVLEDVVRVRNLTQPPPKQSIIANLTGWGRNSDSISEIDATDGLRDRVWVEVVNPEIIVVGCRMNTPELAQETLNELVSAYRRQYLNILNHEVNEYKDYLKQELDELLECVTKSEQELSEFEAENPQTATFPSSGAESLVQGAPEIGLAREVGDVSPVPMVLQEIARLELELSQAKIRFSPGSERIRQLTQQIQQNRTLLEQHEANLSASARMAVRNEAIKWRLQEARRQFTVINTEYHKILLTEGTKVKQTSSITMLNRPTFEPEQIAPRKKMTLMTSMVMGLFFGLALFYLRFILNHTYCQAEELAQDLDLPVFASLPADPPPAPGFLDRVCIKVFSLLKKMRPVARRNP
ncbi:hypothetical protein P4B35_08150 [Pontiellaceae bacterium B12227]|nr:hypothetical protein [Pontiellaceae bacterium B12227]